MFFSGLGPHRQSHRETAVRRDEKAVAINDALSLGVPLGALPLSADALARFKAKLEECQVQADNEVKAIKVPHAAAVRGASRQTRSTGPLRERSVWSIAARRRSTTAS